MAQDKLKESNWSRSRTGPAELWKNPLFSLQDRLEMADGSIAHLNSVVANLTNKLEAYRDESTIINKG